MLVQIDPELYSKFVVIENGKKVLYLLVKKAERCIAILQGTIRNLKNMGFRNKPIRSMCGEQNDRWETMYHFMAC